MTELASPAQLRMSFMRWAMIAAPLPGLLAALSAALAGSGSPNPWLDALAKPVAMPPSALFGPVPIALCILTGIALAMVLNARSARGRVAAVALFAAQLLAGLLWQPLFFAAHQVTAALWVALLALALSIVTAIAFARIRQSAAWAMLPWVAWLSFAAMLDYQIDRLNPDAESLVRGAPKAQIAL